MNPAGEKITLTIGNASITAPIHSIINAILSEGTKSANDEPAKITSQNHLRIGEFWEEEGGVLLGIMRGDENLPDYYLIAPTDPLASNELAYGGYGIKTPGADSQRDGMANTLALCNAEEDHPAAQWARSLTINGHSDLYLPALRELALGNAIAPELFAARWHLSSTQSSADYACVQDFSVGGQNVTLKDDARCVRAVRRKLII